MKAYFETIEYLETLGVMPDRPPSLETTRAGLERLELSIDPEKVIVVAGTNGKGTVCAVLEALLISAGKRVGFYSSPHLVDTTERIRVNGQDVTREEFVSVFERVRRKTSGLTLTHFEMLTLIAASVLFESNALDFAIFEVGLGGIWDATNAIPHQTSVITRLGLDHENILGRGLYAIAKNKFGIVTHGGTVIHAPLPFEVRELAQDVQKETRSRWIEAAPEGASANDFDGDCSREWTGALAGKRGRQNALLAFETFRALGFDPRKHLAAIKNVRWPGRMQRLEAVHGRMLPCPVYLSGDHNPQGVESLVELLPSYPRTHLHILVGVGVDKDLAGILTPLFGLENTSIYLTQNRFRGRKLEDYGVFKSKAKNTWVRPIEAFESLCAKVKEGEMILVTGSLYLVGEVLEYAKVFDRSMPQFQEPRLQNTSQTSG